MRGWRGVRGWGRMIMIENGISVGGVQGTYDEAVKVSINRF